MNTCHKAVILFLVSICAGVAGPLVGWRAWQFHTMNLPYVLDALKLAFLRHQHGGVLARNGGLRLRGFGQRRARPEHSTSSGAPGLTERVNRALAALQAEAIVSDHDPHIGNDPPCSAREIREFVADLKTRMTEVQ